MLESWLSGQGREVAVGIVIAVLFIGAAIVFHWVAFAGLNRLTRRTRGVIDDSFVHHARRPARVALVILAGLLIVPWLGLGENVELGVQRLLAVVLTATVGWLAFNLTRVLNDVVAARYDLEAADNLTAREVHTRARVLQRVLAAAIMVITVSLVLMAIPGIRQIGVTLFASAGVVGIIAGLAARPALSNLIAGVQLALTQPIRIDDVVIVEGEWGWIEEIRTTFVVVRIWDLRRLVVPLSYFIETPFQNWTRQTADILGTVYLYVDYTVPVGEIREELHSVLQSSDLWDGEVWGLQVTDATEKTVELRALMGARNSGDAWNLRCEVREKLIAFVQKNYPEALPHIRAELTNNRVEREKLAAVPTGERDHR